MWLIYGANGFTGRRIAQEAVARGMRPVLAGRNKAGIGAVADALGCPARVFHLHGRPEKLARHLSGLRVVLHCAGPFSATAKPMMDACLAAGVHYLDITGEIDAIEAAAARHDRAVAAGVVLMPAVGFDVVPSDCLAAMLVGRCPEAQWLELAFSGLERLSPGTTRTVLEGMAKGGRARIEGRIVRVPMAWKAMEIPFRGGRQWAVSVPFGDVAAAWHSTGVPNIVLYAAMPREQIDWLRRLRGLTPLLQLPTAAALAARGLNRLLGRSAAAGKEHRQSLWGRATDRTGRFAEATLETPEGYRLTVLTALAAMEKVLAGGVPPGFQTPSRAFGPEFVLSVPDTDFQWADSSGPSDRKIA